MLYRNTMTDQSVSCKGWCRDDQPDRSLSRQLAHEIDEGNDCEMLRR